MPVLTQGDEEEIDGSLQGDDKVDGIELRETPMKGMQRAADALLDYINVGIWFMKTCFARFYLIKERLGNIKFII